MTLEEFLSFAKSRGAQLFPPAASNQISLLNGALQQRRYAMLPHVILELYKNVERFFSFSCNRQHVEFEKILLRETIPVDYFGNIKKTTIEFELFVSSDSVQRDIPVIGRTSSKEIFNNVFINSY
jgi:hypothetical protein